MITRVWGECNGSQIEYTLRNGQWYATVPRNDVGEWAVAIFAEDEAGNVGYKATMVYAVDPITLCISVTVTDINTEAVMTGVVPTVIHSGVDSMMHATNITAQIQLREITAHIVSCQLCGRW